MPRPICVECRVEYHCEKNEFLVRDPDSYLGPPTYWSGDLFECPGCGNEIVVGFGQPMELETGEAIADRDGVLEFRYR